MAQRLRHNLARLASTWQVLLDSIAKYFSLVLALKFLGRAASVTIFTLVGLSFVGLAALLISVIQFQTRIIEAKNQSKNFSLTSLTQSVSMQKDFINSVKKVQDSESIIAQYQDFRLGYSSELSQYVSVTCQVFPDPKDQQQCVLGIAAALQSGTAAPVYVKSVIAKYIRADAENFPRGIDTAADAIVKLADQRSIFDKKNGDRISEVRLACNIIERYATAPTDYGGSLGQASSPEKNSFIGSLLPQYVMTARMRCYSSFNLGSGLGATSPSPPPANTPQPVNIQITAPAKAATQNLEGDLAGALLFDLMSYYRFYENLFTTLFHVDGSYVTEQIVIAPIDITFVVLVIACGALGAMLRITVEQYNPRLFGKQHSERKISWVYYFIIGIMCSLIVYILAKTAFAGVTETAYVSKSGNLSPFVTAFLAIVSGLLCEEAFQQIIGAGRSMLARTGVAPKTQATKKKTKPA